MRRARFLSFEGKGKHLQEQNLLMSLPDDWGDDRN